MNKKITAIILIVCMMVSILPVFTVSADNSPFYKLIAEDVMDKTTYGNSSTDINWTGGKSPAGYGTGWSDNYWTSNGSGPKNDISGVFAGRPGATSPVRITRNLASNIDFSKAGTYTFKVQYRGSIETQSAVTEIGNTGVKFGVVVKDASTGIFYPQLQLPNGAMVIGETSTVSGINYTVGIEVVLEVTVNENGNDTLKIKVYSTTNPTASWMMTETTELSGLVASYISTGFDYNSYSKQNGVSRIYSVKVEYDNPNGMNVIAKAKGNDATINDVNDAFGLLVNYEDSDKAQLIADVKANANSKGFDIAPKIVSATPDFTQSVKANDFGETITINYSYPLKNEGNVSIKNGDTVVAELASISGKTVTLNKVAAFDNDTPYVLTVDGVVDFKGDAVSNYSFRTAIDTEVHASAFEKLYAEDTMTSTTRGLENNSLFKDLTDAERSGGTGFAGPWTADGNGAKFEVNGIFNDRPSSTTVPTSVKRTLANEVDLSKDGVYTFVYDICDAGTIDPQSAVLMLGNSGLEFGGRVDVEGGQFYPQIKFPGENTFTVNRTYGSTNMRRVNGVPFRFVLEVTTSGTGIDTWKLKAWSTKTGASGTVNAEPAFTWTGEKELSGVKFNFVAPSFYNSGVASSARPTGNGVSRAYYLKIDYKHPTGKSVVEAGMSENASLEDVKKAFNALLVYDAANKSYLMDAVKAVATNKGYDLRPELASADPDFVTNSAIDAQSFGSTFTLTYDYPLEGTGVIYVKQGDNTIAQSTKIEGNTVTMSKFGLFAPGKFYDVVSENVKDFKGDLIKPFQFSTYVIPTINVINDAKYDVEKTITWEETDGMEVSAKLYNFVEGTIINNFENNTTLTVAGTYRLAITASLPGMPSKTTNYDFEILADLPPQATNIKVELDPSSTSVATGATLKGSYKFVDDNACDEENKDEVTGTSFQWYRVVGDEKVAIEGATGKKYTLTVADDNHDIVFGVTPKSTSVNVPGETEFYSEPFTGAYVPTATTVTVNTSNIKIGSTLKAEIDFNDVNGDSEGVNKVKWFVFGANGDEELTATTDGLLTVTEDLIGKYIYAIVTPVSLKAPFEGNPVISGEIHVTLPEGVTIGGEEEASDFAQFSADLLLDDVNLYNLTESNDMTDHRTKFPLTPYEDNSVGFSTNWSTRYDSYVPLGTTTSNCFQNSATWGGWGISYAGPANLYRGLKNKIDMTQTGTYTFVTEVYEYNSSGSLTSSDFRMYIGTENWFYGYKAPYGAFVPTLGIGTNIYEAEDSVPYVAPKTTFIKAQIDVTGGVDTFRVKMWTGDSEPEGWAIEKTAELGNVKAAYIAFTPNPAASNGQRYVSFKATFENVSLKEKIMSVAGDSTATEEEIHDAFAALSTYPDGSEKDMLISALSSLSSGVAASTAKVVETSVSTTDDNVAHDIEKLEFKYDFMLNPESTFTVKDKVSGEVIATEPAVIKENKVTINVTGDFEGGNTYVVEPVSATDYKGSPVPSFEFTTMDIPSLNVSDGGIYSQNSTVTWTGTATVTVTTPSGVTETATSPYVLAEAGNYSLTIEAGDTLEISFRVDADIAPVAKNITVRGFRETGNTITATYDYYDANGDAESGTTYQWYRKSGDTISAITGATALTYTLTLADEDCDLIFGVTTKSNSTDNPGGTVEQRSEPYAGAYKPEVKNLKVAVDPANENVLYASYDYYDKNGDLEGTPVINWFLSDGTPITENVADGKLTITPALYEQIIEVRVQPYAQKAPVAGRVTSSPAYRMPAIPVVSGVTVSGLENATSGSVIVANYTFTDPNGDHQSSATTFEWKNVSTNAVYSNTNTLTLTSEMSNATILLTVYGMSEKVPYAATPVTYTFTLPYIASVGGVGGGNFTYGGSGSGSGSSGGGGGSVAPSTPVTPVTPEKVVFGDTKNHWAKTYVDALLEQGIVMEDENFRPNDSISRAELLAMLFRSSKSTLSDYTGSFGDVNKDDWFAGYIQTALDMGIVSGAESFRPNDAITREETAKIVANMLKLALDKDAEFNDKANVSDWAVTFVSAVVDAGIFKGDDNGNFNPKGSLTRAETATVIYRLLQSDSFKVGGAE